MGIICIYCQSYSKKNCGRTFHQFPRRDPNLLMKWVKNMNKANWKPEQNSFLCSDHFEKSCFDRTGFRVHLNKNSVPTIFIEAHCSACKKKKSQSPEVSFHKFPVKNHELLQQWVENITFDTPTRMENSLVCSDHFEKSCFRKSKGKISLKRGSIPTLFERSEKRKAMVEVDDDVAIIEHRPFSDSSSSTPKRIKLQMIDNDNLEKCEPRTAEVSDSHEITSTPDTCDSTVDSNMGGTDHDNDISLGPESDNDNPLDSVDGGHEQSITGTSNCKQNYAPEISTPKTSALAFDHDHHYFDSPNTLRRKLANARKVLVVKNKLVQSQRKCLQRIRRKVTSLQEVVSVLRDEKLVSQNALSCLDSISDNGVREFINRTKMKPNGKVTRTKYRPSLKNSEIHLKT